MAVATKEVTCRYDSLESANRSIALLRRNGWIAKKTYQEGNYYYVVYDVPIEPDSTPKPNN
ncbi:MAG: hypothetical protein HUK18_06560 [Bacteroidales bacterium]|nr:hypothetical protein [Bacteroidales bacterium]